MKIIFFIIDNILFEQINFVFFLLGYAINISKIKVPIIAKNIYVLLLSIINLAYPKNIIYMKSNMIINIYYNLYFIHKFYKLKSHILIMKVIKKFC